MLLTPFFHLLCKFSRVVLHRVVIFKRVCVCVIPGGGHGKPLHYSCLENPMDRGAWEATVHGVAKSQTWLKQLSLHACVCDGHQAGLTEDFSSGTLDSASGPGDSITERMEGQSGYINKCLLKIQCLTSRIPQRTMKMEIISSWG